METLLLKSDKFVSFYTLLEGAFWDVKDNSVIAAFDGQLDGLKNLANRLLTYPSDIPALQGATDKNQHLQNLFGKLKNMSSEVFEGNISDIDGLKNYFSLHFGFKSDELESSYQSYSSFFEKNNKCIHENVEAMRYIYNDRPIQMPNLPTDSIMPKTTGSYIETMRKFFEVPSDKMIPTVHLHPFPEDPHLSGWATSNGIHQTLCVKRLESDDKYIDNTTMLARRVGTPLHESAHWMFENSPIMESFKKETKNPSPAVQHFISVMDRYLKENPEKDYYAPSPVSVMHEALASSAGVVLRPDSMKNFDYTKDELYYGFKAGNDLARVVYPIFHEYIASGKKISDGFFERVISDDNFKKQFCLSDQNNVTKKTSTLQKTLANHVISTPKVQKGAILLDTNKIGMLRKHQSDR